MSTTQSIFTEKVETSICLETPSDENPYIATDLYCYGYAMTDLVENCSYSDMVYLMIKEELPEASHSIVFKKLLQVLMHPGPRHPAVRAAMAAGAGKSNIKTLLPVSLSLAGGAYQGTEDVRVCYDFLKQASMKSPEDAFKELEAKLVSIKSDNDSLDHYIAPGFGSYYQGIDIYITKLAALFLGFDYMKPTLIWANSFCELLKPHNMGWLRTSFATAVLMDLGFTKNQVMGLYQLAMAPALLAHGLEYHKKHVTRYPFLRDEHYEIE